jgi:hypothetical protein
VGYLQREFVGPPSGEGRQAELQLLAVPMPTERGHYLVEQVAEPVVEETLPPFI